METSVATIDQRGEVPVLPWDAPWRVRGVEEVVLTPAQAAAYQRAWQFPDQRPLAPSHVQFLAREILAGRLVPTPLVVVWVGEAPFLIDGQHRLQAVITSGRAVPMVILHFTAPHYDAVRAFYARIDRPRVRSYAHIHQALDLPHRTGLPLRWVRLLDQAAALLLQGFGNVGGRAEQQLVTRSPDVRAQFVEAMAEEAGQFIALLEGTGKVVQNAVDRTGVLLPALLTLRYQPELARAFWSRAVERQRAPAACPERQLMRWLQEPLHNRTIRRAGLVARVVAAAWNAAFAGEAFPPPDTISATGPVTLLGTPYQDGHCPYPPPPRTAAQP